MLELVQVLSVASERIIKRCCGSADCWCLLGRTRQWRWLAMTWGCPCDSTFCSISLAWMSDGIAAPVLLLLRLLLPHLRLLCLCRSLSQTVAACQLIIQCLNESNSNGSDRLAVPRDVDVGTQFVTFKGRKSLILSEASLNILVGSLPTYLYGAQCSVRYVELLLFLPRRMDDDPTYSLIHSLTHSLNIRFSISSGGGSLFSLLHAAESAPYQACLLVVRDSFG